jgi:hypothetical protein
VSHNAIPSSFPRRRESSLSITRGVNIGVLCTISLLDSPLQGANAQVGAFRCVGEQRVARIPHFTLRGNDGNRNLLKETAS